MITKLFKEFFESEKTGGLVLVVCTIVSLLLINSPMHYSYQALWETQFAGHSTEHWINDGLMTVFFLLIGLELEREIYAGELSSIKNVFLPLSGALGGMIVPAGIYLLFNTGTPGQPGAGIPMATDIAFALGILSLLGPRVPVSLKIFLTALAVIDDLGAIIIIAIFYTKTISWTYLFLSLLIFGILLLLNRMKVHKLSPYLVGGVFMWYFMLHSGVHATITGILLAFAIPFGTGDEKSPSYKLQHFLHKPVAFFILPLFALANTAIIIGPGWQDILTRTHSIGISAGLLIGKPLGIVLFCFIAVASGLCKLPEDLQWKHLAGAGILGGIGFTMSVFITLLAFDDPGIINDAKFTILIASTLAGIAGFTLLKASLRAPRYGRG